VCVIRSILPASEKRVAAYEEPNPRVSLELRSLLPYPNSCPGTSPHQQERDTKMAMLSFGGIDVSKDRLDVMLLPEEECASVIVWRYRCVEGSPGRHALARGGMRFGEQ
jgi:hypothetical protein